MGTPRDFGHDGDEIGAPDLPRRYCPAGWHNIADCESLTEEPQPQPEDEP